MLIHNKKYALVAAMALCACIFSCNQSAQTAENEVKTSADSAVIKKADTGTTQIVPESKQVAEVHALATLQDTIFTSSMDTMISLKDGNVLINGHITDNKTQPRFTFTGLKGQTITATIKPVKKGGNVRINQVQQPGGAFDGPFGDSLSYTLKLNGKLKIIIGENMMAGDPYSGNFLLRVRLDK